MQPPEKVYPWGAEQVYSASHHAYLEAHTWWKVSHESNCMQGTRAHTEALGSTYTIKYLHIIHMYICKYIYIYIYIHIYTYIYLKCIHMHIHTHLYIYQSNQVTNIKIKIE